MGDQFMVSATVDFFDDCSQMAFTRDLLVQLLSRMRWLGARRVYWNFRPEGRRGEVFVERQPAVRQPAPPVWPRAFSSDGPASIRAQSASLGCRRESRSRRSRSVLKAPRGRVGRLRQSGLPTWTILP